MGRKKFCYWSVADGQHALMMQTCVRSARASGVTEDFHVWSDRAIAGAFAHDAGQFDKHLYHFKFDFLQEQAARLHYVGLCITISSRNFGQAIGRLGKPNTYPKCQK